MKLKSNQLANVLLGIVILSLFLVGNRISLIIQSQLEQGQNILMAVINAFGDLPASYGTNYLGFTVGFDLMSILMGIGMSGGIIIAVIWGMSLRKNYRPGEEHGSSKFGDIKKEANPLKDEEEEDSNMICSQDMHISMNTRKTFMNDNFFVIGGSGSGKTRFFVKPNVLQMYTNIVVTDPDAGLLRDTGKAFEKNGYDIKVLNLVDMLKSMQYNPLKYINKPNDVLKFINNLVANTTKENTSSGGDDFFVKAEIALLTALCFYVLAVGDENEKNIKTIMDLIDLAEASEEDEDAESVLDIMFQELAEETKILLASKTRGSKNSYSYLAQRQYNLYKKAAGKTAKSILISVGVRMAIFNIPEVEDLLSNDSIDLETIGKPKKDKNGNDIKTILYVVISDSDSTFTFIASILFQQLFDELYITADKCPGGRLPIHTRFYLDEFANTGKIPDFERKIATMRKREISVAVILQNLAQMKSMYKESWETIFGNCDTTLFLGGKEPSTLEYISKLIGNTTIDYLSVSESKGSSGSWSRSNQLINRALMDPAEIGRMDPLECLIHIRGHQIYKDRKFVLESHKRIEETADAADKTTAKQNIYHINLKTQVIREQEVNYDNYNFEVAEMRSEHYVESEESDIATFTSEDVEAYLINSKV